MCVSVCLFVYMCSGDSGGGCWHRQLAESARHSGSDAE